MNWVSFAAGTGTGIVGMLAVCGGAAWYVQRNPAFLIKRMMRAGRASNTSRSKTSTRNP